MPMGDLELSCFSRKMLSLRCLEPPDCLCPRLKLGGCPRLQHCFGYGRLCLPPRVQVVVLPEIGHCLSAS